MDEEDGRPGPGTRQFGPVDALKDALAESAHSQPSGLEAFECAYSFFVGHRITPVSPGEKPNENVPGK
jgi:hypothetical protein